MSILSFHHLSFFRDPPPARPILTNIHWSVAPGQIAAILGSNGCGKSTLLRLAAGYLWPQKGTVQLLGQTLGESGAALAPLRARIGIVEANTVYPFDDSMTVLDVALSGYFSTLTIAYVHPTADQRTHAQQMLAHVGLDQRSQQLYATLSTGQRMRALIARALVRKPELLLLDEPTAGLDLPAREAVLATLSRLHQKDTKDSALSTKDSAPTPPSPNSEFRTQNSKLVTPLSSFNVPHSSFSPPSLIIVTHHLEELLPATSNILLLSPTGTTIASGPPETVLTDAHLSAAYNIPIHLTHRHHRYHAHIDPQSWPDLL